MRNHKDWGISMLLFWFPIIDLKAKNEQSPAPIEMELMDYWIPDVVCSIRLSSSISIRTLELEESITEFPESSATVIYGHGGYFGQIGPKGGGGVEGIICNNDNKSQFGLEISSEWSVAVSAAIWIFTRMSPKMVHNKWSAIRNWIWCFEISVNYIDF